MIAGHYSSMAQPVDEKHAPKTNETAYASYINKKWTDHIIVHHPEYSNESEDLKTNYHAPLGEIRQVIEGSVVVPHVAVLGQPAKEEVEHAASSVAPPAEVNVLPAVDGPTMPAPPDEEIDGPRYLISLVRSWWWEGRFHPVPKNWQLPYKNLLLNHLWDLWYFGIPADGIAPFRFLHGWDVSSVTEARYLSVYAKVMGTLEYILSEFGLIVAGDPLPNNHRVALTIRRASVFCDNPYYNAQYNTPRLLSDYLFSESYGWLVGTVVGVRRRKHHMLTTFLPCITTC